MNADQPFFYNENDLDRAIQEIYEGGYNKREFTKDMMLIPITKAVEMAGNTYRPFIESMSLIGRTESEIKVALLSAGRNQKWCDMACIWLKSCIPAIVFIKNCVLPASLHEI